MSSAAGGGAPAECWKSAAPCLHLLAITFFISVLVSPRLPEPLLPTNRTALHPVREKTRTKITLKRTGRQRRVESLGQMPATYDPVRAAFYVSWDPTSLAALQQHFRDIDLLIPERLHSITATGRLDVEADPKLAAWVQTLQQQTPPIKIPTMPLLNNSDGTNWLTDEMAAMLKSPAARRQSGAASGSISHTKPLRRAGCRF